MLVRPERQRLFSASEGAGGIVVWHVVQNGGLGGMKSFEARGEDIVHRLARLDDSGIQDFLQCHCRRLGRAWLRQGSAHLEVVLNFGKLDLVHSVAVGQAAIVQEGKKPGVDRVD